jgi:hypothetical protein
MNISAKKIALALFAGTLVMLLTDFASGMVTDSLYVLPLPVLVGAMVAGSIVIKYAWLIGVLVGAVNSIISIIAYSILGPIEHVPLYGLVYTIIIFLSSGLAGGYLGGIIGARLGIQK